jgi:hypothetical protein
VCKLEEDSLIIPYSCTVLVQFCFDVLRLLLTGMRFSVSGW